MTFKYQSQIDLLLNDAEKWHKAYYMAEIFSGPSLRFHRRSLDTGIETSFAEHLEFIYATLASWGMHRMGPGGSKMVSYQVFRKSAETVKDKIFELKNVSLNSVDSESWAALKEIFCTIKVMASGTTIVGNSKVMAHLLSNLISPIDRQYTFNFLRGNTNLKNDQALEWELMKEFLQEFFYPIATNQSYINLASTWISQQSLYPWDTSILKTIDNLLIGHIRSSRVQEDKSKRQS